MKKLNRYLLITLLMALGLSPQPLFGSAGIINATADGVGVIIDNNTALARDQAIQDALRIVVEQAAGVMVASETLVQNYEVLSDQIYSKSQGYIKNYQVTDEKTEQNLYKVTVQAAVAE